ncbi:RagB/SusD family nutrient uptake outer membrane protein [Pedobacter sp. HMWF019]|uniref:RagB/SusD family nutrient uptake outer membrane protein n=1 Tax=Pedobacter sp. HMWF019 TaxID=2056856 RepID=UPI000D3D29CC|nr:RagB/SusD family nutrient uptake outer membrane protein [Pedobacter sp. HMWF019]PTT01242.1 RagB/SusD family nutrient uptake outer membrane protein [Pedobacter sp. HMWF019]
MKLYSKISIILAATVTLSASSCKKDFLKEEQRTQLTQQSFSTPVGVIGSITGVYGTLRGLWGTEGFTNQLVGGTDETLAGGSTSSISTFTYVNLGLDDYRYIVQNAYQGINTLNGVLLYGTALTDATQRTQYLAQAKFLRGMLYYYMVVNFGEMPLHTTFITDPTTSDKRAPLADLYAQIIKDFSEASKELQVTPGQPFGGKAATQATALYFLGKAYLTRGWSKAAQSGDFATAASTFQNLIANRATYGVDLWQDFADAFKPANDYGKEVLFVIDESSDAKYGNYVVGGSGGNYNVTNFLFRPNYPSVTANYPASTGSAVMTRDVANGRPFIRIRPNTDYMLRVFAERNNDTRFDKSFQTTWIANTAGITTPRGALTVGTDTAIWTPPFDPGATKRASFKGVILIPPSLVGAGSTANAYTPIIFPSLKKYDDPSRAAMNDPSTRPFILVRFADVYLLAAEAYFKSGDLSKAADMLNVIRTRAAYKSSNSSAQNATAVAAMQISSNDVTLDFILDERSRELYEECTRWWDLTRTQSLGRRLQAYNSEAYPGYSKSSPADAFALRPIPLSLINLVTTGDKFPQNPGY